VLARLRSTDDSTRWWLIAGVATAALLVPLLITSPGNDLDVANVFRSGRAMARNLSYVPSRPPGAPVHEAITGVLDVVGGPILTNLASLAAAAALLVQLERLLASEGLGRHRRWAVAFLGLNPWFLVAATSTADYVFALLFVVLAGRALREERPVVAGLWAAAAMGSRVGSITLLAALAIAQASGARPSARRPVGQLATAGVVALVGTALAFVPAVLAAGGLDFAQNDFTTSSPLVQLGRAAAKDLMLVGLPTAVLLLVGLPAVVAALRRWSSSWAVRFALSGLLGSQLLFIRFPWKMAHLLPTLLCLAVLMAVAFDAKPRWLMALVAFQVLFALVRVDVVQPDAAGRAQGARLDPGITWGPLAQDLRCRFEHPDAYLGRQTHEVEPAWECASPFRD
jgi:hypothetical protein